MLHIRTVYLFATTSVKKFDNTNPVLYGSAGLRPLAVRFSQLFLEEKPNPKADFIARIPFPTG